MNVVAQSVQRVGSVHTDRVNFVPERGRGAHRRMSFPQDIEDVGLTEEGHDLVVVSYRDVDVGVHEHGGAHAACGPGRRNGSLEEMNSCSKRLAIRFDPIRLQTQWVDAAEIENVSIGFTLVLVQIRPQKC